MDDMLPYINLVVEGRTDELVLTRILQNFDFPFIIRKHKGGKQSLLSRLENYNQAAKRLHFLVVIDLDQEFECAPNLVHRYLPYSAPLMIFRVAVREIESWLLADRVSVAKYFGIPKNKVSHNPDNLLDAKLEFVTLAQKSSYKLIREDIVPEKGTKSRVGSGYTFRIEEFVQNYWRPEVAAQHSDSLRRCILALQDWTI